MASSDPKSVVVCMCNLIICTCKRKYKTYLDGEVCMRLHMQVISLRIFLHMLSLGRCHGANGARQFAGIENAQNRSDG
jgi:hypothetical protein